MRMTMPQIIMLNHASSINYKRSEARSKAKANNDKPEDESKQIVYKGKKIEELTSEEMVSYMSF